MSLKIGKLYRAKKSKNGYFEISWPTDNQIGLLVRVEKCRLAVFLMGEEYFKVYQPFLKESYKSWSECLEQMS